MNRSSEPGVIAAGLPAASFVRRGRGGAARSRRAVPYLRRQLRSRSRHARSALTLAGIAVLAIPLLAAPAGAQQPSARAGANLPVRAVRQIEALLAAKAQRTAAQRKVSSQLLNAAESAQLPETAESAQLPETATPRQPAPEGIAQQLRGADAAAGQQAGNPDGAPEPEPERVTVDIRADVTPAVLARIRTLGGTVIDSVPKYEAIRAQLPLRAMEMLAALDAIRTIRPADEAVTRKDNTSAGDVAHRAKPARTAHGVDGTGIGIGVISNGVRTLADRQASGDLPARVTVLPGQEGSGDEGTALLEIVHDLAPGAELYFATGNGGQARFAANIESLCEAGANVIVDDIGYTREAAFQDDIVAQGVNAAVAGGCYFFSAGGNDGNLTDGTTGVWEGDYAAGTALIVDGETLGVRHDFGGGVEANEVSGRRVSAIVLQWADPLGASANDYDLFLVNEDGDVVASSTDTQDGTQDPIESILSPFFDFSGLSLVVVKASGSDRYLRVHAFDGRLAMQTAGNLYGHSVAENAVSVAMVDVRTAAGSGRVFNGTESVRTNNSDGPRRIFFQPDGTAITAGNFSSTGGKLLQKPDLTAATCVTTATPGFSPFCGTSAAAPHAAAIGALMLEAAGGPNEVTLAQLRTGMTSGTAVLDIETTGFDRDSGYGIVMAPGAVDAVDVVMADRNGAPTVENAVSDRTFAPGATAVMIDLANVFDDPPDDTLTYEAISSDPDRLAITRSGSMVTLTPGSPGRAVVTLRAVDPGGLSAVEAFSVTVSAGNTDYDADNDGLIDVANLAQLDALRYDLNADGLVDGATWMPYYDAFPMGALGMGCPTDDGCTGYELTANLDFDTDDDGDVDSADDYWNSGDGWEPIGEEDAPFTADFKGNRRTVSNLFIDRDTEDGVGLFGEIGGSATSVIRGVGLVGVDVTGRDGVGSLLGHGVYATVIDSHATGQVSGEDEVGGVVGRTWGTVWYSSAAVNVSGEDAVGGLVGHQILNDTVAAYATGNVSGMNAVGGLIGAVSDVTQVIEASYATGNVSGSGARLTDSDSGFIICNFVGAFTVSGPAETTTSSGGGVGGLVGSSCGYIQVSYATGAVSGTTAVGGLVGSGRLIRAQSSYWDVETSGVRVGVGEDDANDNGVIDGTERLRLGVGGKTTAELQTPTDYTAIYEAWNVELGSSPFGDGELDDPWDFGTTAQYPVLSLDLNDDNRATWEEFGYQVRSSVTLTAATPASQAQVVLSWTAISIPSSWSPAPDVSYTLYRDDGTTIEAIETDLTGLTHTDSDVTIDDPYTYWVAGVVDGGEAARSAPVSVIAGGANQPPVSVGIIADRQLAVGSMSVAVDVAAAFQDPDNDTLTYRASSSVTSVATLSRSGSMLTITPGTAGRTIITVTATDAGGSNKSASQRFIVTVGYDYDTDGDGLIGVSSLAQLDAMRYDLDGNGYAGTVAAYAAAFPSPLDRQGCGVDGCSGYELLADLDFDTDRDGAVDSDDDYWNAGDGWEPIGWDSRGFSRFFNTTFDGNEHTLSNLFTAGRRFSGLFSTIGLGGGVNDLTLADVNVTGTEAAGALVGENQGLLSRIQSSGQVSGELHVGGLVGLNLRLVYLSRSSAAVTGMRPPLPPGTGLRVTFGPPPATGGLVGYNTGFVVSSYATGPVTSDSSTGGLVGWHQNKLISGSYATGPVNGYTAGGLVGTIGTPFEEATIRASYATGTVSGTIVGGLVGHVYDEGIITASYATGRVDGRREGGLVGEDEYGTVTNSYWDTRTSGQGSGAPGSGRTTSQLQSPTGYSGIYGSWNVDIDEDNTNDNPWTFGTSSQYPALKADMDGDDDATWEEFGYQLRSGPTLTATATTNAGQSQVELEWTEAPLSSEWTPAPSLSYTVTREDDDAIDTIAENLTVREYTDTDVAGETYIYQVVAVVDGGEAVRSATVSVTVAANKRPLAVGTLRSRRLLVGDSAMTEVGGAFEDPEGDAINYGVSSSDTTVAQVTLSGTRVTIVPVAEGATAITVTATDETGSNQSRSQQFTVTVLPATTVDYDTDDDGLIEINNLAQLDAVRHDLSGYGWNYNAVHTQAFPNGSNVLACGGLLGCVGYELNDDLDFDTDRSGEADAGDAYWNNGAGWAPIGSSSGSFSSFAATFEGNGRTITNLFIDSSGNDIGLFGVTRSSAVIRNLEMVSVQVTGTDNVGGLVGSNGGAVSACYATGRVSGDDDVGGLVGVNLDDGSVSASYSTVHVTGDDRIGGLAGSNNGEVTAAYATGRVVGDSEAGGLIGGNTGDVKISYSTGLVSGRSTVGGLVGRNSGGGSITESYWDTDTSGRTTGSYGQAKNTAELQLPTSASDIYLNWNVDLDGDGMNDAPWEFGTSSQYPVLSMDTNGIGGATSQEFGQQIRTSPALMTTPALGQVTLTWSEVSSAAYNLYRTSGTTVEILSENTSSRTDVDTDVTAGATYVYQVAAVINGGEASRSPQVSVVVPILGMRPTVTLELMPTSISENSGTSTVMARLSPASTETTTVTVSATAVSPAVGGDFTLSMNTTLTITAGQTTSTGTVTITANDNTVDTPGKTVRVSGTATNSAGVTAPSDVTLTIIDEDDPPMVTLELMPTSIEENGGSTTVTVRLNRTSSETTTVTVSATAVSPAVARDFRLSTNRTLTIPAGQTTSTGTVTLTANNNDADTPNNTVRVSGTARNRLGVTNPDDDELTITDDDDAPTVTLRLSRTSIGENSGSTTVTARLDRKSSETTTVTVSAMAVSPAVSLDFALSADKTLTITAGETTSTGTVTLTANNNDADTPDNTVRVSGTARNRHGVTDPADVTLTITDDDDPPRVTLQLMPTSIGENGGSTTVTARLDRESSETTTVTVSAMAVSPAVAEDLTVSVNKTLTILEGQKNSTGTVTITTNNNDVDTPNKTVRVSGAADNSHGVTDPADVTLTITDDDAAPVMTLEVRPAVIAEAAGNSAVTVRITNGATFAEDQEIRLSFTGTAAKDTDYTVGLERLTLTAGESSTATTVTAVDDAIDDETETILITARHGGGVLGAEQTITITDDDASPVIITNTASPILVEENETAVATLTATDADRPAQDLTWRITGGADRNRFRLTAAGVLTFASAQDYEAPGDSDRNGDYEVTIEVTDAANPVEALFTVRLEDVDDTAPVLSSASVNGPTLTLTYGEPLDGSSRPVSGDFTVSGGNSARTVSNVGVSGQAVTLTLDPAVEHGETEIRVSYRPGTNPIQDTEGNAALGLSNEAVTNNTGDTTAPAVSRVEITSRPERNATYAAGKEIAVTVTFSETVVVTGTPRLNLDVGGINRPAAYRSGTGAAAVFIYMVADGESDTDGVSIEANSLTLNGGRIRDGANNNALLTHDGLAADAGHKVDGIKPALAANGGAVVNGATLTLTYGEALDVSSTPLALAFTVNIEGAERTVSRVAVSGSAVTLTLEPEVGVGQAAQLTYRVPGANLIQDTVGNAARAITNRTVENNTRDTTAPSVSAVAITSDPGPDGIYAEEDVIEITVTFSETVVVDTTNGTPSLALTVGRPRKPALYSPGTASVAQRFTYTVGDSDSDTDGVSIAAGRIALNGGTIQDLADNPSLLVYEAVPTQPGHTVDGVRPVLRGASVSGATLTLPYGEALDGDSTPAVSDFTVNVAGIERPLTEILLSGSTVTLTLDSPVTPGETVTVSYTAGTRPIQDAAGNAAEDLTEYTVGSSGPVIPPGPGPGPGPGPPAPPRPTTNTDPVITTPGPFDVAENETRVVRIEALDSDPGDAIRSYAIAGGADGALFSIVAHTGVLSFREPPNFEAPADVGSTDPPSEAGDNEYIVVVRVASGPLARDRTVEQAFAVRVTDADRESPGAPEAPRLTRALDSSLTVEWTEPENPGPPITGYDVQYREGPSGFFINAPHEGTGQTATLTGLKAATLYQVQVRASNEEGTGRWSQPGEGLTLAGPTALLPFSVPDRGGISFTSQGTSAELRVGYGQVETDGGMTPPAGLAIFGSRVNGILASEAGVPASAPVLEGRIFAETAGPVRTGLALANPNDTAATIAFFFTNTEGIDFGHGTFTLGPREQIARFLDEGPFNGGSTIEGTFTFTADLPVAVIALRGFVNERSEFLMTTLPVAPLAVPTTATVYFPHFAAGGGWTTQVILVNPTHAPISGNVQFLGPGSETEAAAPATLTLADGRSGSTFSYAIPPRSATRLRTSNPTGPLEVGSVRAVPDAGHPAPSGVSIFTYQKDGMTVSEAGVPASTAGTAFRVYVEASGTPGQPHSVRSGIALTNTSGAPTTVSLELTDLDGAVTGPAESLTIPASGHAARFINEFFPAMTTPFSGILRIASTAPDIAAVGLRLAINQRHDILVTTTPPADENVALTASDLFFPHFVDSGGWTTQFILFSGPTGQTASGVIRFTGQDGQPLELSVAPTAPPTIP